MVLLIVAAVLLVIWFVVKPYFIHYDTVLAFTGGLGSGKSLVSTQYAIRLLRKNRWKVRFWNLRHPKKKKAKPLLYSSIPFRISRKEWAVKLTPDHLLLRKHITEKSVCFIDEIDAFASQFDYNLKNILENFNEWCRLYRHYTKGGYLVCNTQATDNLVLQIRRRVNTVFNLMHFKKWFFLVYTVKVRNISISEELKTIEEEDVEDNMSTLFGFLPIFMKHYDTYCYSGRYDTVPELPEGQYSRLKTNVLLTCPRQKVQPLTNSQDPTDSPSVPTDEPDNRLIIALNNRPPSPRGE